MENNPRYTQFKLDNGLVVALQNIPGYMIYAKLNVNYSVFHEKNSEQGMSHFLEHCLVTGGSKNYTPQQANNLRDTGFMNAFTSLGKIQFVADMLTEDFETWLDLTSDHIFNPRFDVQRVEGERKRVQREIADSKSGILYGYQKVFNKLFYGNHPKGKEILGSSQVISNASVNLIKNFHASGFHPNNMDLILVGNLPENTLEIVEKYFGNFTSGKDTRFTFPKLKPLQIREVIRAPLPHCINVENPDESCANISLDFRGPIKQEAEADSVWALNQILGGDVSSRLYQILGLDKGLSYSFGATYDGSYNVGQIAVNAKVPAKRIGSAVDAIFNEIHKLKTELVDEENIQRVKRKARYGLLKTLCSNEGFSHVLENYLEYGLTIDDLIKRYEAITPESVLAVANKYYPDMKTGKYILCVGDPLKK